jgi:alcohol sulfotransferase
MLTHFFKKNPGIPPSVSTMENTSQSTPETDVYVISFPKSGRTWFSHLYYSYFMHAYDLQDERFKATADGQHNADNIVERRKHFHGIYRPEQDESFLRLAEAYGSLVPYPRFTHATEGRGQMPYYKLRLTPQDYLDKPVVFLTRDPRDVLISYYYHVSAKGYGLPEDVTLSEFARSELFGIRYIVNYMNLWAEVLKNPQCPIRYVTYEAMKTDPEGIFSEVLRFLNVEPQPDAVHQAVEASSFDAMKKGEIEKRKAWWGKDVEEASLRFRKGKVGEYQQELEASDIEYLNAVIARHLDPFYEKYHL